MSDFPLKNDCFVTSITLAGLKKLGLESLDWDPYILRDSFEDAFGIDRLSQKMFDKLNCGYTLIGTNLFPASIEGFLTSTAIMNDFVFDESEIPYCTLKQCAWSIWEYANLTGEIENDRPTEAFCPEVAQYIRTAGEINGISEFPDWMAFAVDKEGQKMPDLSSDVQLFEQYRQRQQDYVSDLNVFVAERQQKLAEELEMLKNGGFIAKNA